MEENLIKTYQCEKCGHTTLEEVMENVVQLSTVSHLDESGCVDYGEHSSQEGDVVQYQCETCGEPVRAEDGTIPDNGEDLRDALKFRVRIGQCAEKSE